MTVILAKTWLAKTFFFYLASRGFLIAVVGFLSKRIWKTKEKNWSLSWLSSLGFVSNSLIKISVGIRCGTLAKLYCDHNGK